MTTDLHHRSGVSDGQDYQEDDDISLNGEPDNYDNYAADTEDMYDSMVDEKEYVDPGPFRYNRRVCVAAVPSFILLIALVGELLVLVTSFGLALLMIIDHGSDKQRSVVTFMLLFIPCHILVLYSIFPLLWLSILNIFLLVLVNAFILMTGAWILVQFAIFRKREADSCCMIEQFLFSIYPGISAMMLTWGAVTVIPIKFAPLMLIFIGFIFQQIFMAPTTSSFKQPKNKDDEDMNILNYLHLAAIAAVYSAIPTVLQLLIGMYRLSFTGIFTFSFGVELLFLMSVTVFLTTLMSIRPLIEAAGLQYSFLIKVRWISGAIATILCYHYLKDIGISSHFLPWLPAAIAVYSAFGALLGYKKYKGVSSICFAVAILFSVVWAARLPWRISYEFIFSLPIKAVYVLILLNAVICLSAAYIATHGQQEVFSMLICVQTLVFVLCEVVLFEADLYGWPLFVVTTIAACYTLQRLHLSRKFPLILTCACMSLHITKSILVLIYVFVGMESTLISVVCMLFLVFMVLRVLVNETRPDIPKQEVAVNLILLCLSVAANVDPLIYVLGTYLFGIYASAADVTGICLIICGVLVIAVCILHMRSEVKIRQLGIAEVFFGLLIILLQPEISLTWYCLFEWGQLFSLVIFGLILYTDFVTHAYLMAIASSIIGISPGIRAALVLYPEDAIPMSGIILFIVSSCCLVCTILFIFKARHLSQKFEKYMISLCIIQTLLSTLALISDLVTRDKHQKILLLPAWKLFLSANIVICVCLRVLAVHKPSEIIPLTEKKLEKELPWLPVLGNITTVVSYILICLISPVHGFIHDVWCCAAGLILVCLQKDMRFIYSLKESNQTAPTKMAAIVLLTIATLYRSSIWNSSSWTFARSVLEVLLVCGSLPTYYVLWGILWKNDLVLSEKVVVFILPLYFSLLLYGSSFTSFTYGIMGIVTSFWMMGTKLPLIPYLDAPNR